MDQPTRAHTELETLSQVEKSVIVTMVTGLDRRQRSADGQISITCVTDQTGGLGCLRRGRLSYSRETQVLWPGMRFL